MAICRGTPAEFDPPRGPPKPPDLTKYHGKSIIKEEVHYTQSSERNMQDKSFAVKDLPDALSKQTLCHFLA